MLTNLHLTEVPIIDKTGLKGTYAFALTVEPANRAALEYQARVERVRAQGNPTLPSTLDLEIQVNPFLRCNEPAVIKAAEGQAGRSLPDSTAVFGVLRAWKDQFR